MFDFSFTEMMLAGVVALIVLGPERLPKVARFVGEWVGKIQRMASGVKNELMSQTDYTELSKIKNEVEQTAYNIQNDLREMGQHIHQSTQSTDPTLPAWERLPEPKTPADFGIEINENEYDAFSGSLNCSPITGLQVKSLKKQAMSRKRDRRPRYHPTPKLRSRK